MSPERTRRRSAARHTLGEVCAALEQLAPLRLAQSWDNVGLLAGDRRAKVDRVSLCIDLTGDVADEAVREGVQLVMAYHPPIFKPITRLAVPSSDTTDAVFRCIANGVAIYSTHTALDAALGGTNDVLAEMLGIEATEPLEHVAPAGDETCKLVTFVPPASVEDVADALFEAGAGRIGDYGGCSFRSPGVGTFLGSESTNPRVGQSGVFERVKEIRFECVVPRSRVSGVVGALRRAHPYEEPAFDVYPLIGESERGIGRVGLLPNPISLGSVARALKEKTRASCVQVIGSADAEIRRAVILAGSAGTLPFRVDPGAGDVIVTGEIRHHDALAILRRGCCAIALGHWSSEQPVLQSAARRLGALLPGLDVHLSVGDRDPFSVI